ncbi:hypothetical protein [Actinomycetospora aeridis]|uniref:PknH-like protein n=1 Tax=Actinomycetospora aeridis TaxID=3129231 RepID=A0ABU8N6F9_9PSEU
MAVAAAVVAIVVLGVVLVAKPGGLLPAAEPCAAAPGSELPGFVDMLGPSETPGTEAIAAAGGLFARADLCTYGTGGANLFTASGPMAQIVMLARLDPAAVQSDPQAGPVVRGEVPAPDLFAGDPRAQWRDLPRSGVRARVIAPRGAEGGLVSVSCSTADAYWGITALGPGQGVEDTVRAVDALAVAMACEQNALGG